MARIVLPRATMTWLRVPSGPSLNGRSRVVGARPRREGFELGGGPISAATLGNCRPSLRPVLEELRGLFAEELNRRGITTAEGGKWYAAQVIRVRGRLA
jgi:hypothetical protein